MTPRTDRVMTTPREESQARDILTELQGPDGALAINTGQHTAPLPHELAALVERIIGAVARGQTVTVGTVPAEMTTSSAAALLGISRPTLMRMIQEGSIPAHRVGSHHRLRSQDVFATLRSRREREREALAALLDLEDGD